MLVEVLYLYLISLHVVLSKSYLINPLANIEGTLRCHIEGNAGDRVAFVVIVGYNNSVFEFFLDFSEEVDSSGLT